MKLLTTQEKKNSQVLEKLQFLGLGFRYTKTQMVKSIEKYPWGSKGVRTLVSQEGFWWVRPRSGSCLCWEQWRGSWFGGSQQTCSGCAHPEKRTGPCRAGSHVHLPRSGNVYGGRIQTLFPSTAVLPGLIKLFAGNVQSWRHVSFHSIERLWTIACRWTIQ